MLPDRSLGASFRPLIDSIGEERMGARLTSFLYATCRAEHATVFQLEPGRLTHVLAASIDGGDGPQRKCNIYSERQLWRRDPCVRTAELRLKGMGTALVRADIPHLTDSLLRDVVYTNICDRLLICCRSKQGIVGVNVSRSSRTGSFSAEQIAQLSAASEMLLAIVAKHIELRSNSPDPSLALTSLDDIQSCIASAPQRLSRREAEVCARTIYGVTALGIALELGLSEETVVSYRKRVYLKFGVATQRELLRWYLAAWSRLGGNSAETPRLNGSSPLA